MPPHISLHLSPLPEVHVDALPVLIEEGLLRLLRPLLPPLLLFTPPPPRGYVLTGIILPPQVRIAKHLLVGRG